MVYKNKKIFMDSNILTTNITTDNADNMYCDINGVVYRYTTSTTNGYYNIVTKEQVDNIINEKSKEKELRDKRINKLYEIFND